MKSGFLHGWYARIVAAGWVLLLVGTGLVFVAPVSLATNLVKPLWVLSVFVVLGSLAYVAAYALNRLSYWRRAMPRKTE